MVRSLGLFIASRDQNNSAHDMDAASPELVTKCASEMDSLDKAGSHE